MSVVGVVNTPTKIRKCVRNLFGPCSFQIWSQELAKTVYVSSFFELNFMTELLQQGRQTSKLVLGSPYELGLHLRRYQISGHSKNDVNTVSSGGVNLATNAL